MKVLFISAAWFNWIATAVFVAASEQVLTLFSLESSPTALFFLHLFFALVFVFGIAYYRAASDPAGHTGVIRLGAIAKLALVVVATLDVVLGLVAWPILIPLFGDLVYGLLFLNALARLAEPIPD